MEGINIEAATVYLIDHLENTITNLSEENYEFLSNAGTFNNRFTLQFQSLVLDANDNGLEDISIYPNPTNGQLHIVSSILTVKNVKIYDLGGRVVEEQSFTSNPSYAIDLSRLDASLYFVEITTENGSITKRIVKH
jgi:hypothetical protein